MKGRFVLFLCICMAVFLTSCGERENEQTSGSQSRITESGQLQEVQQDLKQPESGRSNVDSQKEDSMQVDASNSRILIAYFTWAENTHVENPDKVDVDASTSASVLPPGNAAKLAGWIQERTGGELFSIVVKEPYSSDYDECLERAEKEEAENARPELVNHVTDMEKYDVVFLGFPNWWYTVPMAVHSFLEEYDFSGKTVIPFCTHGTGGLASTMQDIKKDLPDSVKMLEPIGIYRPDVDSAQDSINEWLDSMGYGKEN